MSDKYYVQLHGKRAGHPFDEEDGPSVVQTFSVSAPNDAVAASMAMDLYLHQRAFPMDFEGFLVDGMTLRARGSYTREDHIVASVGAPSDFVEIAGPPKEPVDNSGDGS